MIAPMDMQLSQDIKYLFTQLLYSWSHFWQGRYTFCSVQLLCDSAWLCGGHGSVPGYVDPTAITAIGGTTKPLTLHIL